MPLDEFPHMTLQACMQREGCPLCRAAWRMDAARVSWYVNDGVLDAETRSIIVRSLGFCAPHTLYLSLSEGNGFLWSHLGSCMVYVDVFEQALFPGLKRYLASSSRWLLQPIKCRVFSPLRHLTHHDLCPLCFDHRQHEATYREHFANAFSTYAGLRQAYLQADSLCLPHFRQVRSALQQEKLVRMLEVTQFHTLQQCELTRAPNEQSQLRQYLCLLDGSETILWSDFILRVALNPSQVGPPPCLACQESAYGPSQMSVMLLSCLEEVTQCREGREHGELSICSWHAWWLLQQVTVQPARISQLEPALCRSCQVLECQMVDADHEQRPCYLCEWVSELETLQVRQLQHQLRNPPSSG